MTTYDSVRREVFYSILVEFGVPMKVVRLIPIRTSLDMENINAATLYGHAHIFFKAMYSV
jgi:hypothetical protein